MTYKRKLRESAEASGSMACLGLDPVPEFMPHLDEGPREFFSILIQAMAEKGLAPGAFKPNIGYYQGLDKPLERDFSGSLLLVHVLELLKKYFPAVPVILDSKRGDIARSSLNYAREAFLSWQADAVTVAPYMGRDSVEPFWKEAGNKKGLYVLCRTSNPGAGDFQNHGIKTGDEPLRRRVARFIAGWQRDDSEGVGAVVGATSLEELKDLLSLLAPCNVPLLIPGVGSQGGQAHEVRQVLEESGCDLSLVRINSSSGITHPWKGKGAPSNWLDICLKNLSDLIEDTTL